MKHIIKHILFLSIFVTVVSCKMELPTYNQERNRLNFIYASDTLYAIAINDIRYTFVFEPTDVMYDTIWVPVRTMGFISNKERQVSLRQIESDAPMAVADKHYISLKSTELTSKFYWIGAGNNRAQIPIVVIRHPDLKEAEYSLSIEIEPNEDFDQGYPQRTTLTIYISDILMQPSEWTFYVGYYFLGDYGKVKHQFMIDCVRDRGMIIDNAWILSIMPMNPPDMAFTEYWAGFFTNKLMDLNRERAANSLDVLKESDGTIVRFNVNGTAQPYI